MATTKPKISTRPKIGRSADDGDRSPSVPQPKRVQYAVVLDPREEFAHLKASLRIDKHSLDEDCIRQPVLYQELCELHVMANSERDAAKENLSAVDAKVAHEVRVKWNAAGEKYAEARVGDAVQVDVRHIDAYNYWSALVRRAAYLGTLVASADQRSKMLRELGSLFVSGYFDKAVSGRGKRDVDAATAAAGREAMRQRREQR